MSDTDTTRGNDMSGWQYGVHYPHPAQPEAQRTWTSEDAAAARGSAAALNAENVIYLAEVVRRFIGEWQPVKPLPGDDFVTSWHGLHLYMGPDLFEPVDTVLVEITHPEECEALPPGAVCWVEHTPYRPLWPTELGRYRIRLVDYVNGGDEDGPNIVTTLDVEPAPDEPASP